MKSLAGRVLGGRYRLLEKISSGGMAIVYKAVCLEMERYVAVKILRPDLVENEEFVGRFKREAEAASALSHPNIVKIYDVGKEEGIYYIVMEYISGKTLKEYIHEKKRLGFEETVKIALQICAALKHAHEAGIVHRDIKPQNILIGDDGVVKVADFGIARAATSATVTITQNNVIGSVHYFSPEQARGGYVDAKSDLYSLGIVLYEMVTGRVPFEGECAVSIALKHIQERVKPPGEVNPDVPRSLQAIIEKLTEKDRDRRYRNADEVMADLKRALEDPDGDFVVRYKDDFPTQVLEAVTPAPGSSKDTRTIHEGVKLRRLVKVAAGILAVLSVISLVSYAGILIYRNNFVSREVEVPDIVGLSEKDARAILQQRELFMNVLGRKYSDEVEEGYIILQDPGGGMKVKVESTVDVVVSLGPKKVIVPDVTGKSSADAGYELEHAGLVSGKISYEKSNMPSGTVIRQSIPAGSEVPEGTAVDLVVSDGPGTEVVRVRKYTGLQEELARKLIEADGLQVGKITREYNENIPAGTVIRQNPPDGYYVEANRKVDLWVSKGPRGSFPKELRISLPLESGKETIRIKVERVQDGQTVYEREHALSEEVVSIRLEGEGRMDFDVYIDGEFKKRVTVDFTKKEDAS